jgi:hypothetical protein
VCDYADEPQPPDDLQSQKVSTIDVIPFYTADVVRFGITSLVHHNTPNSAHQPSTTSQMGDMRRPGTRSVPDDFAVNVL